MAKSEIKFNLIKTILKVFKGQPVVIGTVTNFSVDTLSFIRELDWDFGKDINGGYINICDPFAKGTILTFYLENIVDALYREFENTLCIYFKDGANMNIAMN